MPLIHGDGMLLEGKGVELCFSMKLCWIERDGSICCILGDSWRYVAASMLGGGIM